MKVGEKIKCIRRKKKITSVGLAFKLGISYPAMYKIECGLTDVNLSKLAEIAEALEISLVNLFRDEHIDVEEQHLSVLHAKLKQCDLEIIQLQNRAELLLGLLQDHKGH